MVFDLYSVFRQIIFNVKHGVLFSTAHYTKQAVSSLKMNANPLLVRTE